MAILKRKAYRLEYLSEGTGDYDENGDYQPGKSEWIDCGRCDAVPAGKDNTIQLPDGMLDTYSYTVRDLPKDCREFHDGEKIRLSGLGMEPKIMVVKGFARYQHQCKIWA